MLRHLSFPATRSWFSKLSSAVQARSPDTILSVLHVSLVDPDTVIPAVSIAAVVTVRSYASRSRDSIPISEAVSLFPFDTFNRIVSIDPFVTFKTAVSIAGYDTV
jgi:hypothetical protein